MFPQTDSHGRLRHLLTLEGLPRATLVRLLDRAQEITDGQADDRALAGRAVCTLFFEPSTRTRMSFQRAAQRLGADVLGFDASTSSTTKGESGRDTLKTIEAMGVDAFVVRHDEDGAVAALAAAAAPGTALVNAGDGRHAHPTQGLLDMLTLRQARGDDLAGLRILIVGDVRHSRVARSALHALRTLGVGAGGGSEIRVCGPQALLPDDDTLAGCTVGHDFDAALEGVDAVMMLRLQRERMAEGLVPSLQAYHAAYGLTAARLRRAAPDAAVLHPGPINRGVEIDDEVADGPQSMILRQVANGVAVRMAVLEMLLA
ncbi:aspartate carbamoyltransferase catalytic subunit [Luteimonas sp. SJ-92]|uniref:Aspartate carbamoyltransferase n=1 Tax=Luteimonas salinisoli TaxID=2752307 RepID=A0A853JDS0_9GAMM|nr:aspartate carbamoyltransferase catalytic subunit [Luteimonas salinisoli]NZA27463.1 aspartate carbamoyltransferase catalytic subunit [Luteimonas salinisoli]